MMTAIMESFVHRFDRYPKIGGNIFGGSRLGANGSPVEDLSPEFPSHKEQLPVDHRDSL